MTDPIIEAAARALVEYVWPGEDERHLYIAARVNLDLAALVVAAVTPLIEASALEKAARAFEADKDGHDIHNDRYYGSQIAAAIRALKQEAK